MLFMKAICINTSNHVQDLHYVVITHEHWRHFFHFQDFYYFPFELISTGQCQKELDQHLSLLCPKYKLAIRTLFWVLSLHSHFTAIKYLNGAEIATNFFLFSPKRRNERICLFHAVLVDVELTQVSIQIISIHHSQNWNWVLVSLLFTRFFFFFCRLVLLTYLRLILVASCRIERATEKIISKLSSAKTCQLFLHTL